MNSMTKKRVLFSFTTDGHPVRRAGRAFKGHPAVRGLLHKGFLLKRRIDNGAYAYPRPLFMFLFRFRQELQRNAREMVRNDQLERLE